MKQIIIILFIAIAQLSFAQATKIYNPNADAKKDLQNAISEADSLSKHVLAIIGGNWCPWCIKLHKFFDDEVIDSIIKANYVVVDINYSKENSNADVLKSLEYPQRFGFPVIVILNNKGTRIHTQDSGLLESAETYDRKKVTTFLNNWSYRALMPENYTKK